MAQNGCNPIDSVASGFDRYHYVWMIEHSALPSYFRLLDLPCVSSHCKMVKQFKPMLETQKSLDLRVLDRTLPK